MVRRASPFERPAIGGNASFDLLTSMDTSNGSRSVRHQTDRTLVLEQTCHTVHPDEFSMNYLLIGNTLDDNYHGGQPPSTLTHQIAAVGLVLYSFIMEV
ncbi:unnamed protein product [Miscanthus lutarioriparius]|uniref:Uncharacterized protein n=1 Tax=Miscanthus lutarioriparius TaxID=422564 RepID=A0A811SEU7_9POAL|nr:unnamed protein product [Miscanthus lutarioriparius]